MPDDALTDLCERAGIERSYSDQSGVWHEVPADTISALAAVLGCVARSGEAREETPRLVEPVVVWRAEDGPPSVTLSRPASGGVDRISWRVAEEAGGDHRGAVRLDTLELIETVDVAGRSWERRRLCLPALSLGYHGLVVRTDAPAASDVDTLLIVVPARAYLPAQFQSGGVWGISIQLYALRSPFNWGIGDFGDLAEFVRRAASAGASAVGLNPLHALYFDEPERPSPYSPNSRVFVNPLYIDVEGVPEYAECQAARARVAAAAFQAGLRALRESSLVDYAGVARHKRPVLELLYDFFRGTHLARQTRRARRFRAFQRQHGEALRRFSQFQLLRQTLAERDAAQRYWPNWPVEFRDPSSPAVRRFAARHVRELEFFDYLQWLASEQLAACCEAARRAGMPIGLYRDLAVGIDSGAGDAWAGQDMFAGGWSVGAPPDLWSPKGQDWGLSPINPVALRRARYQPFIELLRANMRDTGALRIDHVLGLWRTFWIRHGDTPARGAYVRYPFADLVGILALESQRARCVVIGEDLGTVPEGLRAALERADILGCRLLYFEHDDHDRFVRPRDYPRSALVAVGSHDLPTLAAYWRGADIDLRAELGLLGDATQVEAERGRRRAICASLHAALRDDGLADAEHCERPPVEAAYRFLARSPSPILMVQLEDPLEILEQINIPGTIDEHPNWRRRLPVAIATIFRDSRVTTLFDALNRVRPAAGRSPAESQGMTVPSSTYRIQFTPRFRLNDALSLVPYLAELGISHVYSSPLLKARPGSEHGYDITDHSTLNADLGTWHDVVRLSDALRARRMGLVLDFVPNHMGIGHADNAWWLDVLEWGRNSIYSGFFDIDWEPAKPELRGKVLLPLLGEHYGVVLERYELMLRFAADEGTFSIWYHDHRLPLRPRSYATVIRRQLGRADPAHAAVSAELRASLGRIAGDFDRLRGLSQRRRNEARRKVADLKSELAALCRDSAGAAEFMADAAAVYGGNAGALHGLLERQHYRLAYWRVAADEVNYRRFFDISDLASIRMENRALFTVAHGLIGRLIGEGRLDGLRLDHIDGLSDPEGYFHRLQSLAQASRPRDGSGEPGRLYIVAEEILARHETLRASWPIAGTTGYDFAALVNGLFVDPSGEAACDAAFRQFCGSAASFDDIVLAAKDLVIENLLSGELSGLAGALDRISERHWSTRDFTWQRLREALREVVRHFPVYRTYVTSRRIGADDRRDLEWAVSQARRSWRGPDHEILDFVHDALTGDLVRRAPSFRRAEVFRFAMRFQQYTAPIMAKSFEDTAFYRFPRLVSLNEVGGDPRQFGVSVAAFHRANRQRARHWPHTMLAGTTHDTKRGEDARARIDVLSELPSEWNRHVTRWGELNKFLRQGDGEAPSRQDEYFLYQTLIGAWPAELIGRQPQGDVLAGFAARIERYLIKAVREAKLHSSWDSPRETYEEGCTSFARGALDASRANPFLADFAEFAGRVAFFGMLNSLSQLALRLTVPGVPDIYQGSELWDLSLVDPDNRQPVDFERRARGLRELGEAEADAPEHDAHHRRRCMAQWPDGRIKLCLMRRILELRRERASLFRDGDYEPIAVDGGRADHLIAYVRRDLDQCILVVTGRLFVGLLGQDSRSYDGRLAWDDSAILLPGDLRGRWCNALTGAIHLLHAEDGVIPLRAAALLEVAPVAVLVRERD
ncbi:MAG: malto-oligosyltrehalose synthase [Alphaproteobacteria bacterium]|nr:malto-oligosyltrehalose synthase [Alphaproteobacteria bacterium]